VLSWATSMEIAVHGETIEDLMCRKKKKWIENKAMELRGRCAQLLLHEQRESERERKNENERERERRGG